ncbi:DUF4261 domain-containing protein [Fictibacillus barbaricus]|uniref:DUF4261 domain-containing protein n=1 Tax=Fictibacillus barbaricus TaxID=182136 RepID=A0ABS2ZBA7_9BACL|nr:DUF4261 domain-containing protein [Fictibacillus barbaricus]MBN3543949.1 DUF4261 domain-containing protein [Fictibacillus barbaricus]GGB69878.1 hypothetical protein GCM10007199_40130 [Fictibacillus barbaricus]
MVEAEVVIGIPGQWKNRTELIQSVAAKSEGYLLAGSIIHNGNKNIGFQVEVYEQDPNLKEAFFYAGGDSFENSLLEEIDKHTFTVYVFANKNSIEGIKEIIDVAAALLKAGGLAVKIETTGVAHTKEDWFQLFDNQDFFPIYSHFVTLIGDNDVFYSCGMKAFGLPDVVVPSIISADEAADLLNNFNLYNIVDRPTFKDGATFSLEEESPRYKIHFIDDFRYEEDDIFFNSFGLYNLSHYRNHE